MRVEALEFNGFFKNGVQEAPSSNLGTRTTKEDRLEPLVLADFLCISMVSRLCDIQFFLCVTPSKR